MRRLSLPLLFLLLVASAAADTQVSAGWLYSGESVTIEDRTFVIFVGASNDIAANYGSGALFVSNNSCGIQDIAKICLDNVEYDADERARKAYVRAISRAPDITITREFASDEVRIGQEVPVTVTIANDGGPAYDLLYTDAFPEELIDVGYLDGGRIEGNAAVWSGTIKAGESETLSYTILPKVPFERSFVATLSYEKGDVRETVYSSEEAFTSKVGLEMSGSVGEDSLYIGQQANFTFNVTNMAGRTMTPTVRVTFDDAVQVTKAPFAFSQVSPGVYEWSKELLKTNASANNRSNRFVFFYKPLKTGASAVTLSATYTDSFGTFSVESLRDSWTVQDAGVELRDNAGDEQLESGQLKTLRVWMQNLNPYSAISNVQVNISTDLVRLAPIMLPAISDGKQLKLVETNFYAPQVSSATGYPIRTNISYTHADGTSASEQVVSTLTVRPISDLTLTQSIVPAEVRSGETATVSLTVANPRLTRLHNVLAQDSVPDGLQVRGSTRAVLISDASGSSRAYTYAVTAPRVQQKTTFDIVSTVTYDEQDALQYFRSPQAYALSKTATLTVLPELFPLTLTKTVATQDVVQGAALDVSYTLTNPSSSKVAKDIAFSFASSPDVDLKVPVVDLAVDQLNPGESITIAGKETLRAKKGGTVTLPVTVITYQNAFGETFNTTSNAPSVAVESSPMAGPVIFLNKSVQQVVNNTDDFTVTLLINNSGTQQAKVTVRDAGKLWLVTLPAGGRDTLAYQSRIAKVGTHTLGAASATYDAGQTTYQAFSNQPDIVVKSRPLLALEKSAPATVQASQPVPVSLLVRLLEGVPVQNVNVTDGTQSWFFERLSRDVALNWTHAGLASGNHPLGQALLTYEYGNASYAAQSASPQVAVTDLQLLSLTKGLARSSVLPGEKVEVIVSLQSTHDDELALTVSDDARSWDVTLAPGELRELRYETAIEQSGVLSAALARYAYNGVEYEARSDTPVVIVDSEKIIKEKGGENPVRKILSAIVAVLTWQRKE